LKTGGSEGQYEKKKAAKRKNDSGTGGILSIFRGHLTSVGH